MLLLSEAELRQAMAGEVAVEPIEQAFVAMHEGRAVLPGVISLELPERNAEYHIKGAYLDGSDIVVFKSANSYYDNPARGLPSSGGFFIAFDADTGAGRAMMFDNGYLTHVRTGLAGAVAARHLANESLEQVAILGCGTQARFQVEYLRALRRFERLRLWDRRREAAEQFAAEIGAGMDVAVVSEPQAAVAGSDCIVTVTPSRQPFVLADWVRPGAHVTAVGADDPEKQELDEALFARADVIVADSLGQCLQRGELHHAVDRGVITARDVRGELGAVIAGKVVGRTRADEISICDLTGVGVQDAAIAAVALHRAETLGLGRQVDV